MKVTRRTVLKSSPALVGAIALSACGEQEPTTSASPAPSTSTPSPSPTPTQQLVTWEDNAMVSHLFFHSLVVDPKRAFDGGTESAGYLDYMITVDEYKSILDQIYERDYILVSPHQLYTVGDDAGVEAKELALPEGKKPLVISFDDLSYYEYMENDGFADRLVLQDGRVVNEYTDAQGKQHIGPYDHLPLLDDFIDEHPDFSHEGAKGVIALTGYNGVLGYRTSDSVYADQNSQLEDDKQTARQIADQLKDAGWEFASHSWGHINFTDSPLDFIQEDHQKWQREVAPIVGETDLLIYPFGADIAGIEDYNGTTFDYLKAQGFNAFFNVDASAPAWGQLRTEYLREARINVDGISLKHAIEGSSDTLEQFFDPQAVVDSARPDSISGTT